MPVSEFADGALDAGTDHVPCAPGRALLLGAGPHLQVEEFLRRKSTWRALSREVVHLLRTGHGWHWALVNRATTSGAAVGDDVG
ncbi:hypothetical protein ACQP2U_24535 [Nocardia sp. CA-084685]|uniref:hypothetical protein n=1 Tax=Nocardia sp. CA-084685 TaxID=3239970 RepID=UPI003D9879C9